VFRGIIDLVDFHRLAERPVSWPSAREEHFRAVIGRAYIVSWGWIALLCVPVQISQMSGSSDGLKFKIIGQFERKHYADPDEKLKHRTKQIAR